MSAVKDENFIAIQGWMLNKLNLKGNELIVYAVIYGFSQDDESRFTGSRRYLAEWCGCTLKTVDNALSSLVAKGLIAKHDKTINGVHLCDYSITQVGKNLQQGTVKITQGVGKNLQQGTVKITHHNIEDTLDVDTLEGKIANKEERKRHSFDAIIDAYTNDAATRELLGEWLQNRKAKRAAMTDNAIKRNIDKLDEYARESSMSVDDYLAEVVRRGWTAFYPIKNYQPSAWNRSQANQNANAALIAHYAAEEAAENQSREGVLTC